MPHGTRRRFLTCAGAALATVTAGPLAAAQRRRYRVLLNSNFSGPQAFFFLAQDRGYYAEAGLDVEFVEGDGAAAIVPRVGPEGFDFGYGDLNALVPLVATGRTDAPIAVYVAFNVTPLTIAVDAAGPVTTAKDLEGRAVAGHPIDAALEVFPAFAAATAVDASRVEIRRSTASMRALVEDMLAGRSAGVFGFVNTITAAIAPAGIDAKVRLRFLEYRHHTPDLYGNALLVSRRLAAGRPDDVRAFVRATNRGLADTVADLDQATDAVARRAPSISKPVDRARLAGTLATEFAHPEGARLGIGDVDDARLARGLALIASSRSLPRVPAVADVFSREFLPPSGERIRTLATAPRAAADTSTPLRILLNSGYSSVNAWFTLADDRGYFRDAGVQLDYTVGRGAYTAAERMADEGFDVGYGDINALAELVARDPKRAPIAVYVLFNRSPSVIAVPAASPIREPRDLARRHVRGHATDVALQTFPALASAAGLDAAAVRISTSEAGMRELVEGMLAGESDGVFGYDSTITAALVAAGVPLERVRFLPYQTLVPELYGSALMVSRRLAAERPALVAALVRAANHGVADVIADTAAAIAAALRRDGSLSADAERARLLHTLAGEMSHPEGARLGLGAIDERRFGAGVRRLCLAKRLPRVPAVSEIVSNAFAVPLAERITRLAAPA